MESTLTCSQPAQQMPNANIPQIYLDTATKDHICLLSDELLSGSGGSYHSGHNFSSSLPDLSGVAPDTISPEANKHSSSSNQRRQRKEYRNDGGGGKSGSLLCVYCSPRMSRKRISKEIAKADGNQANTNKEPDILWIKSVGYKRNLFFDRSRLESNSSAESSADSSVRNASHVSTCATSEYTRFTSCDRLSTLTGDEFGLNRLRRISSNPEAKVFNNVEPGMRDSKSCSDLKENGTLVNHTLVEQKLNQGDGLGLLSPPPLVHSALLQKFEKAKDDEQIVQCIDIVSEHVPREQIKSNREIRVREWLQDLGNTNEQL